MKVVFDTNVLVSALVFPGGRAEEALRCIIEERDILVLSKPILGELLGVLARKFSRDAEELAHAAVFLTSLAEMATPTRRIRALEDEADNRILECAAARGADAIVTGDRAVLQLGQFRSIRLLAPREYLDRPA